MTKLYNTYDILHSPFDVETHKNNFINYLEVVILKDGTIEYAVPSHQKKLETFVSEECPRNRWLDYLDWLIEQSEAICVWSNGYRGDPNSIQKRRLIELENNGLLERKPI